MDKKYPDYNGFRGALNQKSIPSKTTEGRRGAAEGHRGHITLWFSVPPLRFSVIVRAYSQGSPESVIISKYPVRACKMSQMDKKYPLAGSFIKTLNAEKLNIKRLNTKWHIICKTKCSC